MTVAFSLGCFACCAPCDPCTAECDTTPDANFATVYQANDTDGTLQWTGDAMGPIDGPYPGFEGSGPFSQTITLAEGFSVTMPGARFPCYARVKFWRNIGGGEGSEAVTQEVTITCTAGKVSIGPITLTAGESCYFGPNTGSSTATYRFETDSAIPLVSGGDDQSGSPPASWFSAAAECSPSSISVQATISWTNDLIQHNLYGTFVECYDELPPGDPGDCLDCDGTPTPAPETVYLTISNFDGGGAVDANDDPINYDGTYALDLTPSATECARYESLTPSQDIANVPPLGLPIGRIVASVVTGLSAYGLVGNNSAGGVLIAGFASPDSAAAIAAMLCGGSNVTGSVSGQWQLRFGSGSTPSLSFDWELSL